MRYRFHVRRCPHLKRILVSIWEDTPSSPLVNRSTLRYSNYLLHSHLRSPRLLYRCLQGKGEALLRLGRFEEAKYCFLRQLKINRREPYAYLGLAMTYYEMGDIETADVYLKQALHSESYDFMYMTNYCLEFREIGWDTGAEEILELLCK